MAEWLSEMNHALLIPLLAILSGAVIALSAIIGGFWRKNRQTELEIALKREMLERGFSAEEIERVVKASRK